MQLLFIALGAGTGIFWTAAYLEMIVRARRDRTYPMPFVALCANLTWEFYWTFVRTPPEAPGGDSTVTAQMVVSFVWFCFDLVILYQFVRFAPREFPTVPRRILYPSAAATLAATVVATVLLQDALGDPLQGLPGTAQNLLMSALFLNMLLARRDLRGQSLTIAVNKMIGSALGCGAIVLGINVVPTAQTPNTPLLASLTVMVVLLDIGYVLAVHRSRRNRVGDHRHASRPAALPGGT